MMPETTRGLLLGILYVLEFLEFLTSPQGLAASLWVSFYGCIELIFHASVSMAISLSGLCAGISFWVLEQGKE